MEAAAAARLMSSLPRDIQLEILLKLPVESLLSCKCVCKLWFNLISSPKFINDHLKLSIKNKNSHKLMFTDKETDTGKPLIYSIDYASLSSTPGPDLSCDYIGNEAVLLDYPFEYKKGMEFRILGTCNGLICFATLVDEETSIWIWNPATGEYKETQHYDFDIDPERHSRAGFGYDSITGDYKMVRIVEDYGLSNSLCEVEVYKFGSHLSKTTHTFPCKFPISVAFRGVLLNGALHWLNNPNKQDISNYIVCFDISNEILVDVPLPKKSTLHPEDSNTCLYRKIGVVADCLSLLSFFDDRKLVQVEVWVMQEYGVRESWTKLFTITHDPITRYLRLGLWMPVLSLKNGDILMYTHNGFVFCNPKNETVGKMSSFFQTSTIHYVRALTTMMAHPERYVESLVSLDSGTYLKKPEGQKLRDVA